MAERLGNRQMALEQLATAVALRPAMAGLSLLDDRARLVSKAEILARARAMSAPEDAALILAYAGDPATAKAELEARPPSDYRELRLAAVLWLGGDTAEAVRRLEAAVQRAPLDYQSAAWLAGILRAENDPRASRYLRLVRIVQFDVGPGLAAEVTARSTMSDDSVAGIPVYYPGGVYIRSFGGTVLAPGLTLIDSP
jgi:hypothetical protein